MISAETFDSMLIETLDPPLLLVAMPQVVDPFFHRSVVLLLEHSSEGSFGVIINHPLELKVAEVVRELGIEWGGEPESTVFFGGPVQPNAGMTVFADPNGTLVGDAKAVAEGVLVANDTETLKALASSPPPEFRLVVGYAGWSAGQLESELARNDWLLAPPSRSIVFSETSTIWGRALESIGVRPGSLPALAMRTDEREN